MTGLRQALARRTLPHPHAPRHQYTCRTEHVHIFVYLSSLVHTLKDAQSSMAQIDFVNIYIKSTMFNNDFNYRSSEQIFWEGMGARVFLYFQAVFRTEWPWTGCPHTLCITHTREYTFKYIQVTVFLVLFISNQYSHFSFSVLLDHVCFTYARDLMSVCTHIQVCFIVLYDCLLMFLIIILYYWFVCVYLCISCFSLIKL